jgi:hypothetical protein
MADLFGVKLVTATIARISQDCAHRFMGFADAVRDHVAAAPVKHMDETGFRIGGKTQWLHIASTVWLTFYRVSAKRGSLLSEVTGIIVHDHWKPYYTMTGVLHALCNAHHLRELKALVEIEKEDWARKMQRLLRRACHAANFAHQQGAPLKAGLIALLDRCYDTILAEGLAFHQAQPALAKARRRGRQPRRVGHNLLLRLSTRKLDVLRFLTGRVEDWRAGLGRGVSTKPRFQPPPRRTQHADFPHYAPPFASRQGLCDLSCWGDFRPAASHSIGVEQPESVVQPRLTPSSPAEALSLLSMRQLAPDLLLHPIFDEAEALTGVPHREVVHPSP